MTKWRRPQFTILALLAILALLTPSFVWACPVTGRTGNATAVCDHSANGATLPGSSAAAPSLMRCCAQMQSQGASCFGQCCNALPRLPGSDKNKDAPLAKAHADTASLLAHLSQASHTVLITFALPPAPLTVEPAQASAYGDVSGAPLTAQYAPSALAGRAPPLS